MKEWISVDDSLPTRETLVICYDNYSGIIYIDWLNCSKTFNADKFQDVTHWMPLPGPPHDA